MSRPSERKERTTFTRLGRTLTPYQISQYKHYNEMFIVSTEPEFFIKESYNEHQQEKDSWNN